MVSSSSSSAASSSSRSSSPVPQPKSKALKRKHQEQEAEASSSGSDSSSDSDSESEEETPKKATKKDSKAKPVSDGADPTTEKEEPVLSHAERRRQKRLAKQKAAEAADDSEVASKKRKLADGSAATTTDAKSDKDKPKARQNSVWVGNMSFKTTQDDLRRFFGECGEITRINMPTKPKTRPNVPLENRGFAYVDFATPEGKAAAIALSEKPLVGRKLLIKDGDSFEGRPAAPGADLKTTDPALAHRLHSKTAQKILRQQKQPPAPTLFIGNLPFETTEDGLKELFEKHHEQEVKRAGGKEGKKGKGKKDEVEEEDEKEDEEEDQEEKQDEEKKEDGDDEKTESKGQAKSGSKKDEFILRVRMGTFEDSGACKGFAFIDFSSIDNATSALINIKNHFFNGRELKVEYAGIDAVRRGAAKHLVPAATGGKGGKEKGGNGKPFKPRGPKPSKQSYGGDEGGDNEYAMEVDEPAPTPVAREPKSSWGDKPIKRDFNDKRKGPRARPTPGAALALAQRETAAIMPSQGKKVTF